MYVIAYHKSVNIRPAKQVLTEDEFYNLAWDYAIENTPGSLHRPGIPGSIPGRT